jgi:hypothetical protein
MERKELVPKRGKGIVRTRVKVGRDWDGTLDVQVAHSRLAMHFASTSIAILSAVVLGALLLGASGLAGEALRIARDLALIALGGLLRPRGG